MTVTNEQIIRSISDFKETLNVHIATSIDRDKKVDEMYKVLVVGNGVPSIKERMNSLEKSALDIKSISTLANEIKILDSKMPSEEEWNEVKSWALGSKKATWLVVAAFLAQAGIALWKMLST